MRVPRSSRPLLVLGDSEDLAGIWALGALAAFVITGVGFGALHLWLYRGLQITWLDALIGLAATIVGHEALHALAVLAARGRPRLVSGIRGLLPYFHLGSWGRLTRNGGLITMLAPLVVVDLLGVALLLIPAASNIGLVVVVANSMGSVPDLWRAYQLARLPRWVQCEARGATTQVWAPADRDREAGQLRPARIRATPPAVGMLGTWVLCLVVAEAVSAAAVRLAAQWRGSVTIGRIRLASTVQFVSGPDVTLQLWPLLLAGAALGTLVAVIWVALAFWIGRGGRARRPPDRGTS